MKKFWLALPVLAASATAAFAAGGTPVTVKDAVGDNQTAADITRLSARQDGKRVVFEFNLARKLAKGEFLVFFVDADNNGATGGNKAGADFLVEYEASGNGLMRVSKYKPSTKLLEFDKSFNSSFKKLWGGMPAPGNIYRFYFTPSMFGIKPGATFGFYGRAESAGSEDDYTFDRAPNAGKAHLVAP